MKTAELTGLALDWAVFKARHKGAELHYFVDDTFKKEPWLLINGLCEMPLHGYTPTADWHQGGSIIESEKIGIVPSDGDANVWVGSIDVPEWEFNRTGPTPLIAALRCYVASKMGDKIEIPKELK